MVLLSSMVGTTLEESFGLDISTPLWSGDAISKNPDTLYAAHKAFLEAGSHIILTATYQCAFSTFERAGFSSEEAENAMISAVKIACRARDDYNANHTGANTKVALSLGPYAACLYPTQEYTGRYLPPFGPPDTNNTFFEVSEEGRHLENIAIQSLARFHLGRLRVFTHVFEDIDCIAFETIPLAREVTAIRMAVADLIKEQGGKTLGNPWWISFVLPGGRSSQTHADGAPFTVRDMAQAALETNSCLPIPTAIGLNCIGPQYIDEILETLSTVLSTPCNLVVYPNSGEIYHGDGMWTGEREGWQSMVLRACGREKEQRWGKVLVGGCCRTGPKDIEQLYSSIQKRSVEQSF
ncbi:Homocysteine S-methyltransferase [Flagelloscypha sp. PMI_526]|nr:Homocysteine S-methyltransferase [Flagelloscypha sp. PMI_526]